MVGELLTQSHCLPVSLATITEGALCWRIRLQALNKLSALLRQN